MRSLPFTTLRDQASPRRITQRDPVVVLFRYMVRLHVFGARVPHGSMGGTICFPGNPVTVVQGLWNPQERSQSIAVREAQALFHTLVAAGSRLHNARVDCLFCNVHLTLFYISSQANPANGSSRVLSDLDCTLAPSTWHRIQESFGLHTVDLMALPANVMLDDSGTPLPFFPLFPLLQPLE